MSESKCVTVVRCMYYSINFPSQEIFFLCSWVATAFLYSQIGNAWATYNKSQPDLLVDKMPTIY